MSNEKEVKKLVITIEDDGMGVGVTMEGEFKSTPAGKALADIVKRLSSLDEKFEFIFMSELVKDMDD